MMVNCWNCEHKIEMHKDTEKDNVIFCGCYNDYEKFEDKICDCPLNKWEVEHEEEVIAREEYIEELYENSNLQEEYEQNNENYKYLSFYNNIDLN